MRFIAKYCSFFLSFLAPRPPPDVVVLMYHKITGDSALELDLPFGVFKKQINWLAANGDVISIDDALKILESGTSPGGVAKYVITFDDAFEDFYTHAFPVLKDLSLPVTLYVPTEFLEIPGKPPLSRPVVGAEKFVPVTWSQLQRLASSELVTLGAHTHTHREMTMLSDLEILSEIKTSNDILFHRIGLKPRHFAYPRGVWDRRVENIIRQQYTSAALVTGGGIRANAAFDRYRLQRIPVLRSDGCHWFEARVQGRLLYEERVAHAVKRGLGRGHVRYG